MGSVAQGFSRPFAGFRQLGHTAGDNRFNMIKALRGFHGKTGFCLRGKNDFVALDDPLGILPRRRIRIGRSRSNHIQRIANNIRKHNGIHVSRCTDLSKFSAFNGAETLAYSWKRYRRRSIKDRN